MTKEQILKRIEELEQRRESLMTSTNVWPFRYISDVQELERIDSELASCQTALESFVNSITIQE